jgi:signal transduction histidine kinase
MVEPPPYGREGAILPPLLPVLAGSLVSLLFAALLARYFSRPIRTLRKAFKSVEEGSLGTRVGLAMGGRRDELADLGAGFDDMADRLQGLVEDRQRLLHDVSHELRSPLARLQAAIDLVQQQPDRAGEFVSRIERESSRIDRLVGEVLTLARLDSGIPQNQMLFFDLNEVTEAIAEDASFEAETKQCRVIAKLPGKVCMYGSPDLLHRGIENIVRNAIRHTPDGGSVTINGQISDDKKRLFLEVMDEGEGVPESDLKLIFEPFYRSSSAGQSKGYGIGMAITRRVVDAHKGTVAAKNKQDGGLVVTIALPLSSDAAC